MYVPPRPSLTDDPRFGLRLGLATVLAFTGMVVVKPAIPALFIAMPIALVAISRGAFNPGRAIGAPIGLGVLIWLLAYLFGAVRGVPPVFFLTVFALFFLIFYFVRRTGSAMGLPILIAVVPMSIAAMKHPNVLETFRDGLLAACVAAFVIGPVTLVTLPPKTNVPHIDAAQPAGEGYWRGAFNRAIVLLLICLWLYAVLPISDLVLGIVAVFPLLFPTTRQALNEAFERMGATLVGAVVALGVLLFLQVSASLIIVLLLAFAVGWGAGEFMMRGRRSAPFYQYVHSVAAVLVATALTSTTAADALWARILLTLFGALGAAVLLIVLERVTAFRWRSGRAVVAPGG